MSNWTKCVLLIIYALIATDVFSQNTDAILNQNSNDKNSSFSFIKYSQNQLEWIGKGPISNFCKKLQNSGKKKVRILHIGDSHIQADVYTGIVRSRLQSIFGNGGRGLVFPYSAAKTHAAWDYKTSHKGNWKFVRNIMPEPDLDIGICGATVQTKDSTAEFKFTFIKPTGLSTQHTVKVLCKKDSCSYSLKLKTGKSDSALTYLPTPDSSNQSITFNVSGKIDSLLFFINKTDSAQSFFECYGLQLESNADSGILYNSSGINGAGFNSILKQNLMPKHLQLLNPDIVIIDLGINDFLPGKINLPLLEANLLKIISTVKSELPNCAIMLCSVQDAYRKRRNYAECADFAEMIKKTAFREKFIFYDFFNISGGKYSMLKWTKNKLSKKDRLHLNNAGYTLKGELLASAITNTYNLYKAGNMPDTNIVSPDTASKKNIIASDSLLRDTTIIPESGFEYIVKAEERLSFIARKFKVKTTDIKKWNNLKSNHLDEGETLIIFKKKKEKPVVESKAETIKKPETEKSEDIKQVKKSEKNISAKSISKGEFHIVEKGETLYGIARKYKTTVQKIRELNDLNGDFIDVNQKIIIK